MGGAGPHPPTPFPLKGEGGLGRYAPFVPGDAERRYVSFHAERGTRNKGGRPLSPNPLPPGGRGLSERARGAARPSPYITPSLAIPCDKMRESALAQPLAVENIARRPSLWRNLGKFVAVRTVVLVSAVVAGVYITILIANYGGYVDEIMRGRIAQSIDGMIMGGWLRDTPTEEKFAIIEQTTLAMEEAAGLNEPFLLRTFRWLGDGLTLNWGESTRPFFYNMAGSSSNKTDVRGIVLDHLARTLLVFGLANVLLFFTTVLLGLALTRHYGSRLDRLFAIFSPLSAAPAWVYGVLLNIFLLRVVNVSAGGAFDFWPSEFRFAYLPVVLKNLGPPFLAIFIAGLFQGAYAWRTFFLVYTSEDYVEMARAKGLSARTVERRYVLRPALPGIVTSFALLSMSLWQEIIALEYFFNVAGIGRLFITAIRALDTPMIVALVVTFAYLLAVTVFVLDVVYGLLDPRIRVGNAGQGGNVAPAGARRGRRQRRGRPLHPVQPSLALSTGEMQLQSPSWREQQQRKWQRLKETGRQIWGYPTAVIGAVIILGLVGVSIYTVATIPYEQAIALWRGEGNVWARNPRNAQPTWVNALRFNKLPPTIILDSREGEGNKRRQTVTDEITEITFSFPFDYPYNALPQDANLYFYAQYEEKVPHLTLTWLTPDGRELQLGSLATRSYQAYLMGQDERLQRRLGGQPPLQGLFREPLTDTVRSLTEQRVAPGQYELQISALVFEDEADVDVEFVLFGQVHGIAGTDAQRRDLMVALLWGAPIALAFGVAAALVTSVSGMFLAAVGAWFGGGVDRAVQFLTEVNLILPFFPVSLMIYTLYSKSIWVILGVTVALTVFSSSVKTYRAVFLQIKESPYIEAARAYGAGNWRIIRRYLIPRIVAVLIPKLVILVPGYVFLEATLAFLGVSDPVLPTWGKLVVAAVSYGMQARVYHLAVASLGLLFLTGFAFSMLGLALERVFEPRLRDT